MSREITNYVKRVLQPALFKQWDDIIIETPKFLETFKREDARLHIEYYEARQAGKRYMNHRYLSITAKRLAFKLAVKDANILGELECACFGELRYGLP